MNKPGGLYIHIPFCRRKCIYCDFFSGGASIADWHRLVDSLLGELHARSSELPAHLQSIYIGGGTPSLMPPAEFERLIAGIHGEAISKSLSYGEAISKSLSYGEAISKSLSNTIPIKEFTIEVNPEDVNPENIAAWKRVGVNRISMGVQSLVDSELAFLQRNHDAARAIAAMNALRENFDNVSFDIMFGIPGQTLDSLKSTLTGILSTKPYHLSAYSLMYEDGTALTAKLRRGDFMQADDQLSLDMYHLIADMAAEAGLAQYEISNYALPGYESLHNSSYWNFSPYLGIGPSAHSYDGQYIRRANPWNLKEYLSSDSHLIYTEEVLSDEERLEEYVMLRLRTREGIDLEEFENRFERDEVKEILERIEKEVAAGRLQRTERGVALTREALMESDSVILSLLV